MNLTEMYLSLMQTIRGRLDLIAALKASKADDFAKAETAAFHGRKIVEGTAFACLVAVDHGMQFVPKDAKGKWNAEKILENLTNKGFSILLSPSKIRPATSAEALEKKVSVVID